LLYQVEIDALTDKIQAGLHFKKRISLNQGYDDLDKLSAPSFGAPKLNRNSAAETVGTPMMLPLEAWFLGLKIYPEEDDEQPPRDFLYWDEKTSVVTINRRSPGSQQHFQLEAITVNTQVHAIEVSCTWCRRKHGLTRCYLGN
jgi:hypothetical protein